jgi:Family of unknown function (DUF5317)
LPLSGEEAVFLVTFVVLAALTVPLAGGRLAALADVRLHQPWLLAAALVMQTASIYLPGLPATARIALQVLSYPVAGLFLVSNRHLPGMLLVAAGAAGNLLAMSVNGGVMPASPAAVAAAGLPAGQAGYSNSAVLAHPRLAGLGDVFAIPSSWPLANVFSPGDVLIALGVAWALHRLSGSRLASPWRSEPPGA